MANEFDKVISEVIKAEGGARVTNDPADAGGRTQYGISERNNPQAWLDGKVTEEEARAIYLQKYVVWPRFNQIPANYALLQRQMIDFGVLSGPLVAIQKLQKVLGVKEDGVLGPKTLTTLVGQDPKSVNNRIVVERLLMNARICKKDPTQLRYIEGWNARSVSFYF